LENGSFQQLREATGHSHSELADALGYNVRQIYRWESGENKPRKAVIDRLRELASVGNGSSNGDVDFSFIDLFSGIGGMRLGFEAVGGRCVYACERDKFCRETYKRNFPGDDHPFDWDINDVKPGQIPEHDLLVAGFPCQPFSIAGVSKKNSLGHLHGFEDKTQGTLFFNIAQIIKYHEPSAFLLENVKNLIGHDKGKTFKIIMETLRELGYDPQHRVIDAKGYLPQHRERTFIVGFREDTGFDFKALDVPAADSGPRLGLILHPGDGSEEAEEPFTEGRKARVAKKYTLSEHLWDYLQAYAEKHRKRGNGFGFGLFGRQDVARTLSARYYKDGSEILIKQQRKRPRRLTPRECARLMGFDSEAGSRFRIPVSDTQAYKQFGNSVAVPVVRHIAGFMKPHVLTLAKVGHVSQIQLSLRQGKTERQEQDA